VTIGERIKQRRKHLGLSADYIAEKLGKDRATIYRYESDEIENLPLPILEPLAKALKTTPMFLLGWDNRVLPYRTKKVPMLGTTAAGEPIAVMDQQCEYYVEIDKDVNVDFCLKVKGDSMVDARILDGDMIFVRQQPTVENGEIAVVAIDNEVTLKRFYKNDGGVILKPENSKYQPMFYTEDSFKEIRVLGKAVFFQSEIY